MIITPSSKSNCIPLLWKKTQNAKRFAERIYLEFFWHKVAVQKPQPLILSVGKHESEKAREAPERIERGSRQQQVGFELFFWE